ncbi:MAG: hypothetical protein DWQ42_20290 [Planctomycetota bacterium]|nr:MAG: hypothetical protein DWQ42_20290 [Planctomycetota bacterium]REK40449.1 MAG: hypothetical protein DWQ46_16300 [Planctomycetota bacterium]
MLLLSRPRIVCVHRVKSALRNPVFWSGIATASAAILLVGAWFVDLRVGVGTSLALMFWAIRRHRAFGSVPEPVGESAAAVAGDAGSDAPDGNGLVPLRDTTIESSLPQSMLRQQRYALLVRAKIAETLDGDLQTQAHRLLWDRMGLVPEGLVDLGTAAGGESSQVWLDPVLIDRHCVTNKEYFEFVLAGGYQQPAFWDDDIVSGLLDFVDTTGAPGPRFWADGAYRPELANHPVVGISWYEAAAYARWVGKRLPCDAEWLKAASWPIATGGGTLAQRRYPWGNTMDRTRANLWGSGPKTTVPVGEYANGVSVGGLYQLVGNVWEWAATPFQLPRGETVPAGAAAPVASGEVPMKSIRGGAFDTYFDAQATCQFKSGEQVLARKHNIGFRCALSACDVANLFCQSEDDLEEAMI